MKEREEDTVVACNALLAIIGRLPNSITDARALNNALSFALRDIAGKCHSLPDEIGLQFYEQAKSLALRHTLQNVIDQIEQELYVSRKRHEVESVEVDRMMVQTRPKADVVLLTVIPEEFRAALRAFGLERSKAKREFEFRGLDFFAATIPLSDRSYGKRQLRVLITMVGTPRNVPCANVCRDIFEKLSVDVLILSGIAGGNRRKSIKLGDVVAAEAVIDIEGGRSEIVPRIGLSFRGHGHWRDWLATNVFSGSLVRDGCWLLEFEWKVLPLHYLSMFENFNLKKKFSAQQFARHYLNAQGKRSRQQ